MGGGGILGVGCKQTNNSTNWVGWFSFVFDKEKARKKREEIHIHAHNWMLHFVYIYKFQFVGVIVQCNLEEIGL